jgi:hypothetical protein
LRQRAALILSLCLALLGATAAGADEPGANQPDEKAPAPEQVPAPLAAPVAPTSSYSGGLPVLAPGEQAFLLQPQPLTLPPPPIAPVPPSAPRWVEPPKTSRFVPVFAELGVGQRVQVSLVTPKATGFGLVVPANLTAGVRSPVIAGSAFDVADNETPRPLDRAFLTFSFSNVPVLPADPIDGALGLSKFGAPAKGSTLGPGSSKAVSLLQQLSTGLSTPYSHYIQAALNQGNFVLPRPDLVNGALLLANAKGSNFLTPANLKLLKAHSSDAAFEAIVSGALVKSGVTSAPLSNLHIFDRPFDRSSLGQLRTDPLTLYNETFGFEKTLLDGNASVGVRMPVFHIHDGSDAGIEGIGDVTVTLKYAVYNNLQTGNLVSVGLAVTTPTGTNITTVGSTSSITPTLLQPFIGGTFRLGGFYAQTFSSVALPTDKVVPSLWLNDLAIGYPVYSNPASDTLTGILPSLEAQVTTPLTHAGLTTTPIAAVETVILSGALNFTFHRLCFTVGSFLPVTGPHPVEYGGFAQVNFLF